MSNRTKNRTKGRPSIVIASAPNDDATGHAIGHSKSSETNRISTDEKTGWSKEIREWVTLFAVIVGCIVAYKTYIAQDDASHKQLRAYLGTEPPIVEMSELGVSNHVSDQLDPDTVGKNLLNFKVRNYGLTPASNVSLSLTTYPMPHGTLLPDNFPFPDDIGNNPPLTGAFGQSELFSGQEHVFKCRVFDGAFQNFSGAAQKKISLYCYGRIEFKDIYGEKWRTNFCYSCLPTSNNTFEFIPWKCHNETMRLPQENSLSAPGAGLKAFDLRSHDLSICSSQTFGCVLER